MTEFTWAPGIENDAAIRDELDLRHPERLKLRPTDVEGLREAFTVGEVVGADDRPSADPLVYKESMDKFAMKVTVHECTMSNLRKFAEVSIRFEVDCVLAVTAVDNGLGGFTLEEKPVETPYAVDHDERAGEGPTRWAKRFDVSNWVILLAEVEEIVRGGAVVAFDTPNVFMLEGRRDLAVIWDLRVDESSRRKGIGSALIQAAEQWAVAHHCGEMKIETQNVNVSACKFYARQGYSVRTIDRFAYGETLDEVELVFTKSLAA